MIAFEVILADSRCIDFKKELLLNTELQEAKRVVREYQRTFDMAEERDLLDRLRNHVSVDYQWRGVHPFSGPLSAERAIDIFWRPLHGAIHCLRRRETIFFAGSNDVDEGKSTWVCSSGHYMGLFDKSWLGIRPIHQLIMLPYAEFHCVTDGQISETAFFCDILSVMQQAGQYPLPPQLGSALISPGPMTNDGILEAPSDPRETKRTMRILNQMIIDLDQLNKSGEDHCPSEYLARSWHEDMAWYGPTGIGSTYTIDRYQQQHQYPFREGLTDKVYNGHVARFAEGDYAGFFGWPNLNNRLSGGFLGMPAGRTDGEMRVVDIYRRDGDKLAENWVYIDLLHYFYQQGLDLLERNQQLNHN